MNSKQRPLSYLSVKCMQIYYTLFCFLAHKYFVSPFRFKDNNIIDIEELNYNRTLEISNVSGLKGRYRCRVVNDFGSELSEVAYLQVFSEYDISYINDVMQSAYKRLDASPSIN